MKHKYIKYFLPTLICIFLSCVKPGAFETKLGAIESEISDLIDFQDEQNNTNKVFAEQIETYNNIVNKENNVGGIIKDIGGDYYGGSGWIVIGGILTFIVFMASLIISGWMILKFFIKRNNMFNLLSLAISKTNNKTRKYIGDKIKEEANNGGGHKQKTLEELNQHVNKLCKDKNHDNL